MFPGISRARSRIGPGSLATVSNFFRIICRIFPRRNDAIHVWIDQFAKADKERGRLH